MAEKSKDILCPCPYSPRQQKTPLGAYIFSLLIHSHSGAGFAFQVAVHFLV
jgi:hypothetical protein